MYLQTVCIWYRRFLFVNISKGNHKVLSIGKFVRLLTISSFLFISAMRALAGMSLAEPCISVDTILDLDKKHLYTREAEVSFSSSIDHWLEGTLTIAAHSHGHDHGDSHSHGHDHGHDHGHGHSHSCKSHKKEVGVPSFEIHEAFFSSNKLFSGLSVRAGQFFLGVGRLNRIHRHDWPFISSPKVVEEYFGDEGILDSGLEMSYLAPLLFYLNITAGVTNGRTFGHSCGETGEKPKVPTHYVRVGSFVDAEDALALSLGLSFLGNENSKGEDKKLFGFDATAKGEVFGHKYLVQTETWMRHKKPQGKDLKKSIGTYVFPQVSLNKSFKLGSRFDYFTELGSDEALKKSEYSLSPTITYEASEFSSFKLAYNHTVKSQSEKETTDQGIQLQAVFILGAHPAHDF